MSILYNRIGNTRNPFQGDHKKVLCVCSAGLLRSPTMAWVLSNEPYYYNTRAAGIEPEFGLILVDEVLIYWADEIVVAEQHHWDEIYKQFSGNLDFLTEKPKQILDLPDCYQRNDPELVELIKERYNPDA